MESNEIIAHNVNGFKEILDKFNCVGTMLCQFNQESHKERMPTKKSFRGSGVIVDKSHIMTVLFNPAKVTDEEELQPVTDMLIYSVKTRLISMFMRKIQFAGGKGSFFFPARYGEQDDPRQLPEHYQK